MANRSHRYLLALGGVGSGKTQLGYAWHHSRCDINRGSRYSLIVAADGKYLKLLFKGYIEFLEELGWKEKENFRVVRTAPFTIKYPTGHEVLFWSAETKLVSLSVSHIWGDESALFSEERRREMVQRTRCPKAKLLQSLDTTTPEGMNHLYDEFNRPDLRRQGRIEFNDDRFILHSSSFDNQFLPKSYLTDLQERFGWDAPYWENYVLGEWTNLARNAFYFGFSNDNVEKCKADPERGSLIISLDNNVGKMQWVALQHEEGAFFVPEANRGAARNLEEAAEEILKTFPPTFWRDCSIHIAGDAKLHDRSPQSYTTGYQYLEALLRPHYPKLKIIAHRANPLVVERSMTTNKLLKELRVLIDPKCKRVIDSARAVQSDGRGGIIKPSNDQVTHAMEALDHALCVLEPVKVRRGTAGATW